MILFFGEIMPKVFATRFALRYGMFISPVVQLVIWVLFPFVYGLELIIKLANQLLGAKVEHVSKEDVEVFVEEGKKQ
ncbi:MAG: DUF21 domain-containing protein [Candidatus Peribacteria bacterium]|nr:MAG: DUF21 domain-containing protein [Candidatus Peribacteria bacterium]